MLGVLIAPHGYEVVREIGAGSVFAVAEVRGCGRSIFEGVCACKRLRPSLAQHPVARAAMAREIGALERLGGRHAPALLGRGDDEAGPYWLQRRADGMSLSHTRAAYGDPLPPGMVADMLRLALEALAEVHAAGVVHGDIHPDHLFGADTFIDFGLSRWPGIDPALVGEGERGTLPYLAPEVARGEMAPDQANDVYALAATLAYAATGEDPCRAETPAARLVEIGERGCDVEGIERCGLSAAVVVALRAALAFDRQGRVTAASDVLALLR